MCGSPRLPGKAGPERGLVGPGNQGFVSELA
jgi:hypothetical protein